MDSSNKNNIKKNQLINNKNSKEYSKKKEENSKNFLDDSELNKSSNDLMNKINSEAKKIKINITEKDVKIFSKYENLTEEEILNLIKERNNNLIKLSDEKDKTTKDLNKIIKKLNSAIANNADLLCKEESDPDVINELEKVIESKKKSLKISKNMNINTKNQYNSMINKMSGNAVGKEGNNKSDKETQLIGLKNENKNLELQIRKYKDDGVSKQKELEIICEDKLYPAKIKMKSDENHNLLNQKLEYYKKISFSMNSIKNLIKEVEHLKQMYLEISKEKNDDKLENKINFWTELIKNDLAGTEKDIISRIEKNESKFINEIDKKPINKNNTKNKITSTFPNLKKKRYLNRSVNKIKPLNNLDIDDIDNNMNNYNKLIINKGVNSKLIYSQNLQTNEKISVTERYKIINRNPPKGVLAKYSFLKQKPSTSESKTANKNINDNSEQALLKEIKENIIEKDYNDTTDEDYRQLLEKKTQYLETNARLEENIKKIQKTLNKKYNSIETVVQENTNRLDLLKSRNELLEKEINNLHKVYQLTVEQEKIKYELRQKEIKIEKDNKMIKDLDSNSSVNNEKTIINVQKDTIELPKRNNKNKSGYVEKKEDKVDNETREEKLEKIKLKYKDMDNEPIEESILQEEEKE